MGVSLVEYDIEQNLQKREEMMAKSGSRGVPVVDVEGSSSGDILPTRCVMRSSGREGNSGQSVTPGERRGDAPGRTGSHAENHHTRHI